MIARIYYNQEGSPSWGDVPLADLWRGWCTLVGAGYTINRWEVLDEHNKVRAKVTIARTHHGWYTQSVTVDGKPVGSFPHVQQAWTAIVDALEAS